MTRFFCLLLVFISSLVSAQTMPEFAVGGGFIYNNPDFKNSKTPGVSIHEEKSSSMNIGGRVLLPIQDKLKLRSGLYLQEKKAKQTAEVGTVSIDAEATILELAIPLNAQFQVHDQVGVFGGYIMDLPINEYCEVGGNANLSGCTIGEAAKVTHNLNIGGSFNVHEKIDVELSYQHPMKAVLNDVKIYNVLLQAFYKL